MQSYIQNTCNLPLSFFCQAKGMIKAMTLLKMKSLKTQVICWGPEALWLTYSPMEKN
jgi:hypothetical protein